MKKTNLQMYLFSWILFNNNIMEELIKSKTIPKNPTIGSVT